MWFIDPFNVFFILFFLTVLFLFLNRQKWAKIFAVLAFLTVLIVGVMPLSSAMLVALEDRFPHPRQLPDNIEGIIVLGGMVNAEVSKSRGLISLNDNVERITSLVELTKKYPTTKVIFTGGSGVLFRPDLKEADDVEPLLRGLIQKTNTLVLENNARNTYENALLTKKKIKPEQTGPWLLVTSAFHMPRSVGVFREVGINIIPYPVDYKRPKDLGYALSYYPMGGFVGFRSVFHEWLGLLAYYVTGKTSEFFPAPAE